MRAWRFEGSRGLVNGTGPRPIDLAYAWNEQKDTHAFAAGWKAGAMKVLTPRFTWHGGQFVQVTPSGGGADGS